MVWKKSESEPTPASAPRSQNEGRGDYTAGSRPGPGGASGEVATIGPSISIKGDLSGKEDLLIEGRVEGNIELKQNNVTVGREGKVRADIHGRSIRVEGEVRGNLYGQEDVVIRQSGIVQGNILAPRVTLENGSRFKGSIDMEPNADSTRGASAGAPKSDVKKPNGAPKSEAAAAGVPPKSAQPGLQLDKSGARG